MSFYICAGCRAGIAVEERALKINRPDGCKMYVHDDECLLAYAEAQQEREFDVLVRLSEDVTERVTARTPEEAQTRALSRYLGRLRKALSVKEVP